MTPWDYLVVFLARNTIWVNIGLSTLFVITLWLVGFKIFSIDFKQFFHIDQRLKFLKLSYIVFVITISIMCVWGVSTALSFFAKEGINNYFYYSKKVPVEAISNQIAGEKNGKRLVVVNYEGKSKKLVVYNNDFHEKTEPSKHNKKDKVVATIQALKPKYVDNKVDIPKFQYNGSTPKVEVEVTHYKVLEWKKVGDQ